MRAVLALCCLALALIAGACKRREIIQTEPTEEGPPTLASSVQVADPRISKQLLRGFWAVEGNAWRWTSGSFAVKLRPPVTAATAGAKLVARFTIPDVVMSQVKSMAMSAKVNDATLAPETYTQAGEHTYSRDVPPGALAGESVTCDFSLDKYLPPSATDQRALGVVISSIGLEPK